MLTFTRALTLLLSFSVCCVADDGDWRPIRDTHPLLGNWNVLRVQDILEDWKPTQWELNVDDSHVELYQKEAWKLETRRRDELRLTYNWRLADGDVKVTIYGKYKLNGDHLVVCLSDAEDDRTESDSIGCGPFDNRHGVPESFSTKHGSVLTATRSTAIADEANSVSVTSFGNVIGHLGHKLGTVVRIRGIAVDGNTTRRKVDAAKTLLRITSVNGQQIQPAILLPFGNSSADVPPPKPKDTFDYYAHECGSFAGVVDMPKNIPIHKQMIAHDGFHYRPILVIHGFADAKRQPTQTAAEQ
jgi:hypothetical protein